MNRSIVRAIAGIKPGGIMRAKRGRCDQGQSYLPFCNGTYWQYQFAFGFGWKERPCTYSGRGNRRIAPGQVTQIALYFPKLDLVHTNITHHKPNFSPKLP